VVDVVLVGYSIYHYCLMFDRGVVHVVVGCIVYHYFLRFNRGMVHFVVAMLSTITVKDLTEEWFMFWLVFCLPLLFEV